MSQANSKVMIRDLTTGPVLPALLTFALPLFFSNLLQAVYNIVDMIVVGQVVGETGLSGLTIGGDLLSFLMFVATGFSAASQVIIAQYIGAGKRDRLSRFIGTMATALLGAALCLTTICLILRKHILTWLNTPAESWDQAMAYAATCMCGLVFIYGYNVVSAILRGMGDSKRPFVFISIAAVMNLLLDLLFVVGFRWEAFGAALATVMAQAFSFLSAVIYLYKKRANLGFDISLQNFRIDKTELAVLIKMGVPFALRSASVMFSKLFVNSWINSYGVTISAVSGVGHKLDQIANLVGNAINTAGSSMVGQNIGARKYERVKRILGAALFVNCSFFALMMLGIYFFPTAVFGMFTSDAAVLLVCLEYVPVSLCTFVSAALRNSMNAFTGGCGNYKFNFAVAIIDGIIARIGLSMLLGVILDFGYFGLWMGNGLAGLTPFILGGIYFLSGRWKKTSSILADGKE